MKILHIIPSIHPRYGGPSKAIIESCFWQNKLGVRAEIATTHFSQDGPFKVKDIKVYSFLSKLGEYKYSPQMKQWLIENISKYDLVHIHSLYCYSTLIGAKLAWSQKIPYIIRPAGSLCGERINFKRAWHKKFYIRFFEKNSLKNAAAIHFTTLDEKKRSIMVNNIKSYILPQGINLEKEVSEAKFKKIFPNFSSPFLLFISRLHPIKNIEMLLESFRDINQKFPRLKLVIGGDGDYFYKIKLKKMAQNLKIGEKVVFLGYVKAEKKRALLSQAKIFILPSYSENFGIAVAEAMSMRRPIIISDKVALQDDIKRHQSGLVCTLSVNRITNAILKILKNPELAYKISQNGYNLAKRKYDWKKITPQQIEIYKKICRQ